MEAREEFQQSIDSVKTKRWCYGNGLDVVLAEQLKLWMGIGMEVGLGSCGKYGKITVLFKSQFVMSKYQEKMGEILNTLLGQKTLKEILGDVVVK